LIITSCRELEEKYSFLATSNLFTGELRSFISNGKRVLNPFSSDDSSLLLLMRFCPKSKDVTAPCERSTISPAQWGIFREFHLRSGEFSGRMEYWTA
jgi:hypothetical protein